MAAVIEYSYQSLHQTHAILVQALGLLPNTTVALDVIAAATVGEECDLSDDHVRRTTRLLDDLFELNLLEQPASDGFRLHDVLYRFARAKALETGQEWREQVIANGCLMYAARAQNAASSIGYADQDACIPAESNPAALAALEHDRAGAVTMAEAACHAKLWDQAVTLTGILIPVLVHLSHWDDLTRACRCVQEAGERTDNQQWVASALHNLGMAEAHRGNTVEAIDLYRRSADIAKAAGDPVAHHTAHVSYGSLLLSLGHTAEGIATLRRTLKVWRLLEDDTTLTQVLGKIGKAHAEGGHLRQAETYLRNAVGVARSANLAQLLPSLRANLATVLRLSGQESDVPQDPQGAVERARAVGSRKMEANALLELGMSGGRVVDGDTPEDALMEALRIYREIGDLHGQVKALKHVGANAKEHGRTDQAIASLEECADLALQAGDATEAAWSMAHLARIHGDIGHHDDANELFQRAEQIAESTGNELLVAQMHDQQAILLRAVGQTSKAISLLQKSVQTLARRGPSENLAATQTLLGEALVHDHQWDEAARVLRPVAEASSGTVSAAVRAAAFQHLAVLYSHRELWHEAEDAGRTGLALAQEDGSMAEKMRGHLTLGNVLGRMVRWQEASDEYNTAAAIANQRRDIQTLLIILSNQASCHFRLGDVDTAITQIRRAIEIADQLGRAEMETSLRLNLGASLIERGEQEEGIAEFTTARDAASVSDNTSLVGTAEKNLAQAYRSRGDLTPAITSARNAKIAFQSCDDRAAAAKALRLELAVTCQEDNDADPYNVLSTLQATPPGIPTAVIAAFWSLIDRDHAECPSTPATAERRSIHVAAHVRKQLAGIDVDALCSDMADSRRHCFMCRLPIATAGQAELLLVLAPDSPKMVTLAHPACASSMVMKFPARVPELDDGRFEIECQLLGDGRPAVVVDCIGGQGVGDDGKPVDAVLESLRSVGFTQAGVIAKSDSVLTCVQEIGRDTLRAHLNGGRLTLLAGDKPVLQNAPLLFYPRWYHATRTGVLVAMFGRDLQGMTWEDLGYVIRAAETGQLVAAAIELTVTPPSRNRLCVCTPRTGLKFKKCCGSPSLL